MNISVSTKLIEKKEKSLWHRIIVFSFPLMLSNVIQVLFHMADVAIVGRFSGTIALGAVGSTAMAVTLFVGFLIGTAGGVNALVARYIGAKDDAEVRKTVHSSLLILFIIGVIFLLFGIFGSRWLLLLLGTKDDLIDKATRYMQIFFVGMPALALYNFGNAVFSAIGNTKKPLIYLSASGVINVILNLFFVLVCGMDVEGVAIASAVSHYVSAILIMTALLKTKENYGVKIREIRFTAKNSKEILSLGLPSGFQHSIFYIANLFIQAGINSFNTVTVAGISAASNADGLVYDVMNAVYTACSSFIGRSFGEGDKPAIKKTYFITLLYSFGAGAIVAFGILAIGPTFLSLFTKEPEVIDEGMKRLLIMGFSYPFSAFMDNAIAALRGIGKSLLSACFVIIGSCIFRIIWMYTVFAYFHTVESLYLLYICSWTLTAILETVYFVICYKKLDFSKKTLSRTI